MYRVHITDDAAPYPLAYLTDSLAGMPLVAHLARHFIFPRGLGQKPSFRYQPCQWFLDIDMLAKLHRRHCCHGMEMVGCCNDDGIDVLLFIQHDHSQEGQ